LPSEVFLPSFSTGGPSFLLFLLAKAVGAGAPQNGRKAFPFQYSIQDFSSGEISIPFFTLFFQVAARFTFGINPFTQGSQGRWRVETQIFSKPWSFSPFMG